MKASEFRELFTTAVEMSGQDDPEVQFSFMGQIGDDKRIRVTSREVAYFAALGVLHVPALGSPVPTSTDAPTDSPDAAANETGVPPVPPPVAQVAPFTYQPATVGKQAKMVMVELFPLMGSPGIKRG